MYSFGWSLLFLTIPVFYTTAGNPIDGPIPSEIGRIVELETLDLSNTDVSGALPAELGLLPNLEQVYIQGTSITGNLDIMFCEGQYEFVTANCLGETSSVVCSCCTICCDATGANCKEF
jgi:hypothetical protein